jgi:hypothetical protein
VGAAVYLPASDGVLTGRRKHDHEACAERRKTQDGALILGTAITLEDKLWPT